MTFHIWPLRSHSLHTGDGVGSFTWVGRSLTSSSLGACGSCSFHDPITTLPTKVLPYTSMPFFNLLVLQHIYKAWFVSFTNCQTFMANPHAPLRCFNGALWVGSNPGLVFWSTPHYLKNGLSAWPDGKSLLFFPVVSTFVSREYQFRFPPLRVNYPSLYTSVAARIHHHAGIFFRPRCIKKCTVAKRYPCVVSLYFALDAKKIIWPISPYAVFRAF